MMTIREDRYQIRVRGRLDDHWADWFEGMEMTWTETHTDLYGPVTDQARLHGMLAKIRDLGLFLVLVHYEEPLDNQ